MEHSDLFYNLILCSTGTLSLICYIVGSYWYKKVWQKSVRVTVGNRTFGGIVGFFYLCMPISSILTSVYSMFFDSFDSKTSYYTRTSMAFATQIIDQSTIIISFDIAVATLRRTQKPLLQTKLHGFVVAFVCVAMSAFVSCLYFFTNFSLPIRFSELVTSMHIICFLLETLLLNINLCRHKIIPLNYSLSARANLARNIGLLRVFCPYLFLITILTSFGPLVFIYANHINNSIINQIGRVVLLYSCYNVTHIIMTVIFIWSSVKRSRQRGSRIFTTVTGRVMHPRQTLDEHFQQLHFQWK